MLTPNSPTRRMAKRLLAPIVPVGLYTYFQAVATFLDMHGTLAEPEMELVPHIVRAGEAVLDIGANYGVYTVACSRAVGPTGHVYAFEPMARTVRALTAVVKLAGSHNVTIIPHGCGAVACQANFVMPLQSSGAPMAGQAHLKGYLDRHETETTEQVQLVLADEQLSSETRTISLIKCDIEGAELFAFRGALQAIVAHRPTVICEIAPRFLEDFHLTATMLAEFFTQYGYGAYRYIDHRLQPITLTDTCDEDNYVFVHPSRQDRLGHLMG